MKRKRIVVIGGTGTIGKAVVDLLSKNHDVIAVGKTHGAYQVDIENKNALEEMFDVLGEFDGIISTAGMALLGPVEKQADEDFEVAIYNKLMGQVNVIKKGIQHLKPGAFIIVTTGFFIPGTIPGASSISIANAGLDAFVKSLSCENTNGIKVNVVAPLAVKESVEALGMDFPGAVSAADTALVYQEVMNAEYSNQTIVVPENLNIK